MKLRKITCASFAIVLISPIYASVTADKLSDDEPVAEGCEQFKEKTSIWESKPIEIDSASIQILDKISGKVLKQSMKVNSSIPFGNIKVTLKRCFRNSPEDCKEIYAFIEIHENNEPIFKKWLFASSPSINLFSHPIYDVRVEFPSR